MKVKAFSAVISSSVLFLSIAALSMPSAVYGAFPNPTFKEIRGNVQVIDADTLAEAPAAVGEAFETPNLIKTARKSRAQLQASDGTITRVGANTVFSFAPEGRTVNLQQGNILINTPKGAGGAKIVTASASATVLGTTLAVSATPNGGFKTMCLEGSVKITFPDGTSRVLEAGQMTFILPSNNNAGRRAAGRGNNNQGSNDDAGGSGGTDAGGNEGGEPPGMAGPVVNFDMQKTMEGSSLMNDFENEMPSMGLMMEEMGAQQEKISSGDMVETDMVVLAASSETDIVVIDGDMLDMMESTEGGSETSDSTIVETQTQVTVDEIIAAVNASNRGATTRATATPNTTPLLDAALATTNLAWNGADATEPASANRLLGVETFSLKDIFGTLFTDDGTTSSDAIITYAEEKPYYGVFAENITLDGASGVWVLEELDDALNGSGENLLVIVAEDTFELTNLDPSTPSFEIGHNDLGGGTAGRIENFENLYIIAKSLQLPDFSALSATETYAQFTVRLPTTGGVKTVFGLALAAATNIENVRIDNIAGSIELFVEGDFDLENVFLAGGNGSQESIDIGSNSDLSILGDLYTARTSVFNIDVSGSSVPFNTRASTVFRSNKVRIEGEDSLKIDSELGGLTATDYTTLIKGNESIELESKGLTHIEHAELYATDANAFLKIHGQEINVSESYLYAGTNANNGSATIGGFTTGSTTGTSTLVTVEDVTFQNLSSINIAAQTVDVKNVDFPAVAPGGIVIASSNGLLNAGSSQPLHVNFIENVSYNSNIIVDSSGIPQASAIQSHVSAELNAATVAAAGGINTDQINSTKPIHIEKL